MEEVLLRQAANYDYCWNKIAFIPIFKNKTDNTIWRKYRALCITMSNEEIKKFVKKKSLVEKIIKYKQIYDSRSRRFPQPPVKNFDPNSRAKMVRQNMILKQQQPYQESDRYITNEHE